MPSSAQPSAAKGISLPAKPGPRKFIGAVEDEWQLYSDDSEDYTLGEPVGFGASSIVYSALYHPKPADQSAPQPPPIPCALKVLDLDKLPPHSLSLLQRETTLMSLSKHPNVIRVRGCWMDGHKLYIAMRLMNKGSAADIIRYGWPGGFEEDVIACILRQALQGINYLHVNGFIHRDVKAANLLIDDDGTVLLGDLGVAADLAEESSTVSHSSRTKTTRSHTIDTAVAALNKHAEEQAAREHRQQNGIPSHSSGASAHSTKRVVLMDPPIVTRPTMGKRKSFVGTPCWMAPELIQGRHYDAAADIWSFGITALELSQGRPPRSREPPQRVLLKTIQDEPPTLDRDGGTYKYSRTLKDFVDSCLDKDPSKRPTAEQLLQSPFLKGAKKKSYLVGAILKDLPPLTKRQERRAVMSATMHASMDSWDFATTMHSPTTSVHRRQVLEELDREWDQAESHRRGRSSTSASRNHSRAVSWVDESIVLEPETEEGADASSASSTPHSATTFPDPIPGEVSTRESSPPSPSKESTPPPLSPPSEESSSPPKSERTEPLTPSSSPVSKPAIWPSSSSSGTTTISHFEKTSRSASFVHRSQSPSRQSASGAPSLWGKIKGMRKSTSMSGAAESESEGDNTTREKAGLGHRLAHKASMGMKALPRSKKSLAT